MKKECIAMLLAGGQGSRLHVLTGDMAKPAVPFGGKFRIIDFPLSNCANSGIDTVGVLTQYRPLDRKVFNVGQDLMSSAGSASDLMQNIPSVEVDLEGTVSLRGNENVTILINGKPDRKSVV